MSAATAANRNLITAGVLFATTMSAIDTTVVNVSLPHMMAGLSASPEQITWVITSYIVAMAVTMPLSGWLIARLGVKPVLLLSVAGFTLASMLCGIASSLPEIVLFRIAQGVTAAPLLPAGQSVLIGINPPERLGRALAATAMSAMAAPAVGPVLGAWLTDQLSWRWCFYINLPFGVASILLILAFLPKGDLQPRKFDFLGYMSLALAIAAFQLMLDRGPSRDWLESPEVCIEAIVALAAFWVYVTHSLTAAHPLFSPGVARDRNFVTGSIFAFVGAVILYCTLTLTPIMMQGVMGYPVKEAGYLSMPRGVTMILTTFVVGRLDAVVDRRLMVSLGLSLIGLACWRMSHFDLTMNPGSIAIASALQGVGQGMTSVSLSTLAFATIGPSLRPDASAITTLLRNIAASISVATMQGLTAMNAQAMHDSLSAHLNTADPVVRSGLPASLWPGSAQGALALDAEVSRQATMVAYLNDFRLLMLIALVCAPLVLLLRRAPAATRSE